MADLIDRNSAIDSIEKLLRQGDELYPLTETDRIMNHAFEIAASCVYNLPSAQPDVPDRNVGDMISRQAAIDALCHVDEYNVRSVEAIRNLPSAQPEPRWIPVEYRPPEFGKEVLISHKGTVSIDWLTQSEGSAYFFMSGAGIADIDAWMPLPKRYERR